MEIARRLAGALPPGIRERLAGLLGLRPGEDASVERAWRGLLSDIERTVLAHERAWQRVRSLADWQAFVEPRIEALRASLDLASAPRDEPGVRLVATHSVEDVAVDTLVYPVRSGMPGVANVYRPAGRSGRMPLVVVVPSHHTDSTHPELIDFGATWAHRGALVAVPTLSGHGERRLHPFRSAADFPRPFDVHRQDYRFRFDLGMQLALAGRSMLGWLVEDVVRLVDVVLDRPDVDPDRVVLVGSVAGGGSVAAPVAAIDPRVRGLVCFGYGPGPVIRRTGPDGPGRDVPGVEPASWETTRSPARSVVDGFVPWVVLAAVAPRPLVYAHEFDWSADADPVWVRLRRVYSLHGAADRLSAIHGSGSVEGRPPENTHCTHVGALHRRKLDPILARWLDLRIVGAEREPEIAADDLRAGIEAPRTADVLPAVVEEARGAGGARIGPRALRDLLLAAAGSTGQPPDDVGFALRLPPGASAPAPLVVGVCAQGGRALAGARSRTIAALLRAGCAVALVDLRACGPARGERLRGRSGRIQAIGVASWMLGRSLFGDRLADLRSLLDRLAGDPAIDPLRVALWGDSIAPARPDGEDVVVPHDAGTHPEIGEPSGGLLALSCAAIDARVRAVVARGTFAHMASLLRSAKCSVPDDWIVPGILRVGDVRDLASCVAPRPILLDGPIDGRNRAAGPRRTDPEIARWLVLRLGETTS